MTISGRWSNDSASGYETMKMNTRDFSWGKGGRCIWLMTYHPCGAKRQEIPVP